MKRRTLIKATLAGIGTIGILRRVLAAGINPAKPGLQRLKGRVTVNGQAAVEGMLIKGGDTVITGADGEAIYVIGQDAFLQRASSEVRFGDGVADFLRVVSGRLLSVFGRGEKRLTLPTATIGIRGTACYIETDAMKSYFCLCYGEAEVVPAAAPAEKEVIRTRHHDHPIYIHGDPAMPTSMVPATVINHSDLELELLEGLVGRRPPFGDTTGYRY
ncbi:hypothetical protein [Denitratisoma oestradiolicum]|uniref:FecR protein domain-containing protein n=1 Tax=Denitratisoma oestradiolicum TaxID=311182 RepID=A0A6S6XR92_9PROT|nr:hypothetical protein [Denitratisoma oestradiolicum]TWO81326.1 hypothetical protein CBW56_04215 [Denitratisoma oestradiolicum]CAB1368516.1 conserved protein of unknown function [Denitratisoma oestradiolicum]